MGREFASAAARWNHLSEFEVAPDVVTVCDKNPAALQWYARLSASPRLVTDARYILEDESIEAVYCAVPHHLHEELYEAVLASNKHLLGEKPFGVDLAANERIGRAVSEHPRSLVRCSSEMPFYPGGQYVARWIDERRYERIIEVRAALLHSSDLDPNKPINWKRQAAFNGAYGCMGDLGMHVLHLPLRAGWMPLNVRAVLSNIFPERPDINGQPVACDTPDNAALLCEVDGGGYVFPMHLAMKRVAPGEGNTWSIEIDGTASSIAFTTKYPKTLRIMEFESGAAQSWRVLDLGARSVYPTITGQIFESGFSDAILQMWAAYIDELTNGHDMIGSFRCATFEETQAAHLIFTAAMQSHERGTVVQTERGLAHSG